MTDNYRRRSGVLSAMSSPEGLALMLYISALLPGVGANEPNVTSITGRHLLQSSPGSSARVVGVGAGVFVLIFFTVTLGLACLIFSRTRHNWIVYVASGCTYAVLLLILLITPRGERKTEDIVDEYDWSLLWMSIMGIIMLLGTGLSILSVLMFIVLPPIKARKLNEYQDVLRIS